MYCICDVSIVSYKFFEIKPPLLAGAAVTRCNKHLFANISALFKQKRTIASQHGKLFQTDRSK